MPESQPQHQLVVLDELEWNREDEKLTAEQRDHAMDDLIELLGAIDQILQAQAEADTQYFLAICGRSFSPEEIDKIKTVVLKAYRWQYIISGVEQPRFVKLLRGMITEAQDHRINEALAAISSPLLSTNPPQRDTTATVRRRPRNVKSVGSTGT